MVHNSRCRRPCFLLFSVGNESPTANRRRDPATAAGQADASAAALTLRIRGSAAPGGRRDRHRRQRRRSLTTGGNGGGGGSSKHHRHWWRPLLPVRAMLSGPPATHCGLQPVHAEVLERRVPPPSRPGGARPSGGAMASVRTRAPPANALPPVLFANPSPLARTRERTCAATTDNLRTLCQPAASPEDRMAQRPSCLLRGWACHTYEGGRTGLYLKGGKSPPPSLG